MKRRDFLWTLGAAAMVPPSVGAESAAARCCTTPRGGADSHRHRCERRALDPEGGSAEHQRLRVEAARRVPRRNLHPDPAPDDARRSASTSPRSRNASVRRSSPIRPRACGASAKFRSRGARSSIAHRAGLHGARSRGTAGPVVAVPRQEGAGGHLGLLVRVPT